MDGEALSVTCIYGWTQVLHVDARPSESVTQYPACPPDRSDLQDIVDGKFSIARACRCITIKSDLFYVDITNAVCGFRGHKTYSMHVEWFLLFTW